MRKNLLALRPKEREVLTRFYLQEQSPEKIQQEMNLTTTQFRLLKSRSKQKLEQITTNSEQKPSTNAPAPVWSGNLKSSLSAVAR